MREIRQFAQQVKEKFGLERFELDMDRYGIELAMIEVARGDRKQGSGTAAMKALTDYADATGNRIWLSVADRDSKTGTTSRNRLVKFYRRFGFVPNKGRNKRFDLSMYANTYRDPKGLQEEINDIRGRAGLVIMEAKSSIKNITPSVIKQIKRIAKSVHDIEGCDVSDPDQVGFCSMVSEILSNNFGWEIMGGFYLSKTLEPIGDHVWNMLSDGTIVDATALQFHEDNDLRIIPPGDPEQKRYRMEWSQDYNPGMSDQYPELKDIEWSGEYDVDKSEKLRKEHGKKWWLKKQYSEEINSIMGMDDIEEEINEEIKDTRGGAGMLIKETKKNISKFAQKIEDNLGLDVFSATTDKDDNIYLAMMVVPKELQGSGVGTKAMLALTEHADNTGQLIWIVLDKKNSLTGTTSRKRLIEFYNKFGFVLNIGSNRNASIPRYASMYRDPKGLQEEINDIRRRAGLGVDI